MFAHCRNRRRQSAFTLIELLVVISIIALLIAMLMPAIKRARAVARQVQCSSSLRQLYVGTAAYVGENSQILPDAYWSRGVSWLQKVVTEIMSIERNIETEFWCPEEGQLVLDAFVWAPPSTRSYGMNDWGSSNSNFPCDIVLDDIERQSEVFLYTDTSRRLHVPGSADSSWSYPTHLGGRGGETANFADYRHFRNVNMGYADGHVGVPELEPWPFDEFNPFGDVLPLVRADTEIAPWNAVRCNN